MTRQWPGIPFERYADDAVAHCATYHQAVTVQAAIENRMAEVGLQLRPAKTRIVYCKDSNRRVSHEHTSFTFRAHKARNRHRTNFASFLPAISNALIKISPTVRSWRLHRRTGRSLAGSAHAINPVVRGWMS